MKLSFIVLNYKTPHHLRICLEHIAALELPFETETIVVDNASQDESAAMVRDRFPWAKLITNAENTGHCAGNNTGIKQSRGEYILLTNPDILFKDSEDLKKMVAHMDAEQRVGILGPRLHNPDGSIQSSCYRAYSLLTPLYRRSVVGKLPFAQRDIARHLMTDFDHNATVSVDWVLGACMLLRKSTIDTIGALDESFFLYFGDYELCDRARQHGWDVIYFHETTGIVHYHKRESVTNRFTVIQAVSYLTRVHIRDWITYLKTKKQHDQHAS